MSKKSRFVGSVNSDGDSCTRRQPSLLPHPPWHSSGPTNWQHMHHLSRFSFMMAGPKLACLLPLRMHNSKGKFYPSLRKATSERNGWRTTKILPVPVSQLPDQKMTSLIGAPTSTSSMCVSRLTMSFALIFWLRVRHLNVRDDKTLYTATWSDLEVR